MERNTNGQTHRRNEYILWIALVLVILFSLLGFLHDTLTTIDATIMEQIWLLRSDLGTDFFIFITYLGSGYVSLPLTILLVAYFMVNKKIKLGLVMIFNLVGVRLMNQFLKNGFDRTRPDDNPLLDVGGFSFPSGHSMNSAAFIGFLGYLLWTSLRKKGKQAGYVLVLSWGLVLLIGFSRVYLGVHYPSDVIAGFAAGGIWLILTLVLLKITSSRQEST